MNKNKLAKVLSSKLKIRQDLAKKYVDSFFSSVLDILKKEGSITLRGFGVFKVVERKERKIVNPKTKKVIKTLPKKVIIFKPYKKLKNLVK